MKNNQLTAIALLLFVATTFAPASRAQTAPLAFSLNPVFGPGSCILGTFNGYSGSDSLSFTATQTGFYTVEDFAGSAGVWAFIDPAGYDETELATEQAIASNTMPEQEILLQEGQSVDLLVFFFSGYTTLEGCEGDGASSVSTGEIVFSRSAPARPVPALPGMALAVLILLVLQHARSRLPASPAGRTGR